MQSVKFPGLFVIVFGGAALAAEGVGVAPNDVDIVYGGVPDSVDIRDEVSRIATEWSNENCIVSHPLDMHYSRYENRAYIPQPFDMRVAYVVLVGSPEVTVRSYRGLASAIRAFGSNSEKLIAALSEHANRAGNWEISLRASRGDIRPWEEDYCNGVQALTSAKRHMYSDVWAEVLAALPWFRFVDELIRRGADVEGIELASNRSSGGGARIFVGPNGVRIQYNHDGEAWPISIEEGIAKFVAPKVLLFNTSIITTPGMYELSEPISVAHARSVAFLGTESAIGHDATARALSTILDQPVLVNRVPAKQRVGQSAIVLKIRGRLPEGTILDDAALWEIGYDLHILKRIA